MTTLLTTARALLTQLARTAVTTVTTVKAGVLTVSRTAKALWAVHRHLMDSHSLYRATITALTGVVLRQVDLERFILALVAALLRHLRRSPGRHPRPWNDEGEPDGWVYA